MNTHTTGRQGARRAPTEKDSEKGERDKCEEEWRVPLLLPALQVEEEEARLRLRTLFLQK